MTAIELLKSTTEYEVLESFRNKVAKLEEKAQMYSEEDMKQFGLYLGNNFKELKGKTIDEIFEQFKKN